MNKKAIQQIIVLMCAALLGIVGMQVYFIISTLRLNYELFDQNVRAALDHTVSRLEQAEIAETATLYNLPKPVLTSPNNDEVREVLTTIHVEEISSHLHEPTQPCVSTADTLPTFRPLGEQYIARETRKTWKKGGNPHDAFMMHFERYFVHHGIVQKVPIEKRRSLRMLDTVLREELQHKGISTGFVYAVYSIPRDSFVVKNSFCERAANQYQALSDFKYSIYLFPSANKPVAALFIDFPARGVYVWGSLVLHVLGTILFTAIIVFCFYYTIRIIFNQKKLSEMKNDFLNNMTHEFKTPIATISLATDAIKNLIRNQKPEKVERFVNIIQEENSRMNSQVEKVLQMARLDKKEVKLNVELVDAHDIIQKAVQTMSLQVEKRQGSIKLDLQATDALLEADETHFTNVILNLLDNANKYSPNAPEITVRSRDSAGGIRITVEDKGLGISKEARKHIFDQFYRVHTGNLHDIKGFGLGLAYVKAIVTAHAGQIEVRSEPNKGSAFTVFFPHPATTTTPPQS